MSSPKGIIPLNQQRLLFAVLFPIMLTSLPSLSQAGDLWPEFRGPTADGHFDNDNLPIRWSESENVRWKTKLPGMGWGTPVISKDRIWLTSATDDGHEMFVVSVDRKNGKIVQRIKIFEVEEPERKNNMNSYASPSPVLSENRLFIYYGTYGIACLDTDSGNIIWSRQDINLDHQEGPGSSIILYDGRVIFHCDGRDVQFLLALDAETGATAWQQQRSLDLSHVGDFSRKAFTTPLVIETNDGPRLISPAAQGCYCYDPRNGEELWRVRYSGFSAVPRPVALGNITFVVNDFAKPEIHAIRHDGSGDITDSHIEWIYGRNGPSTASPVLVDNRLMFVSDKGVLTCLNARNGKELWKERLGGNFCATPLAAGGLVYWFDRDGKATVIQANDQYEEVAVNELEEGLMASPAAAGNALYLRTTSYLYCIQND